MSLVLNLCRNYFLREKGYWVLLANFELREIRMIFVGYVIRRSLIQSHLTKDPTNNKYLEASVSI